MTSEEFAALRRGLPDYRLEDVIGQGAFGVVLSATQIRMNRRVAVKSLRSDHAHQAEVRRRFATEAQVLGGFQHPHIVDVYDYREGDDFCALVMERLEGGSLRQRLGNWPLAPATACAVAVTVCSALEYAHGRDVLHRDIKPANLLFGRYGSIDSLKLTDFGIAKVVSAAEQPTLAGTLLGTASYMAPEQIEGRDPGSGVDVYGAATLLYEMLSDRLPFSGEGGPIAVANRRLSSAPTPLQQTAPDIPDPLAEVVMRGLERDPADRQQSAQELGAAIARVARTSFGDEWLEDGAVRLLAPGVILDAATGRTRHRASVQNLPDEVPVATGDPVPEDPTRIVLPPPPFPADETRMVAQVSRAGDRHEVEEEYPGVEIRDLVPDPEPVDGTTTDPPTDPGAPPPPTPPPPPGTPWLRWLIIGAVLLLVLVATLGLLRSCDSSADGGGSDSTSAVTCWDGTEAAELSACSTPSGLDELAWMFPSIDDSCDHKGRDVNGMRQVVQCPFDASGGQGLVGYSVWDLRDDAVAHYTDDFGAKPGTWTLNDEDMGGLWEDEEPRSDVRHAYKAAVVYNDLPLSFSVYAHTREDLQQALDEVVSARPASEVQGVSNSE